MERQNIGKGNLALAYQGLGLYHRARRLQNEALAVNRRIGARLSLAYSLGNWGDVEIRLGNLETARQLTAELAEMAPTLGDPSMSATPPLNLGQIVLAEGDPTAAIQHLESGRFC